MNHQEKHIIQDDSSSFRKKKNYAHTHHIPISPPTTLPMQGTMRGGESASGTSVSHFSRQVGVAWGKEVA